MQIYNVDNQLGGFTIRKERSIDKQVNLIFSIASFMLKSTTPSLNVFNTFNKKTLFEITLQIPAEKYLLYLKLHSIIIIINMRFYSANCNCYNPGVMQNKIE